MWIEKNEIKAKPNPCSNPNFYKSNVENTICLICNNQILTNNPTHIVIIARKQDIYMDLGMLNVMNKNYKSMFYFIMMQNLILDYFLFGWKMHSFEY